ncbi:Uncharacterised protein [Salmonella enterica]|uniref:Uncharacterized protein n=1 Tax=Salmonella enterica subsp. arizonae TaxID=59203 RepID=A0A379SI74_SALER|nr:Uncharacterised protein [Salmonella enterica]SUG27964.1 Uncharacterised protein [Salmonella enterica subsp. arizonae]SUG75042.1 Uncharacterised protein [Salmonella enterica]SUH95481.1 Uncharacterised protein [Salmonella enterica subsp. arizonae]
MVGMVASTGFTPEYHLLSKKKPGLQAGKTGYGRRSIKP